MNTVVLHGFSGSAAAMGPLTERLPPPVHALDLPGHGPPPASADPADYTMSACIAGVHAATAHLQRFALVGYSMGGRAALHFALAHPQRLAVLVLISARAGIPDPTQRAERVAADEALADRIEAEGTAWFADHWAAQPLFASQQHHLSDAQRAALHAQRTSCDPGGLARSLRGMGAAAADPVGHRLGELSMPCGLVVGAEDEAYVTIARQMAAVIPRAVLYVIAEAGHATHLEAPEATAAAVVSCMSG